MSIIACSLLALSKLLTDARTRADERANVTHERFNVFTTLLQAHDEVRLHTRFLHNLLNPQGTHDCKSLFLDLFFETLTEIPPRDADGTPGFWKPVPEGDSSWTVRKEASVAEGKIDLLLETQGCGIAIENKIWGQEQSAQLKRYFRYVDGRHGAGGRLLYLTLDGKTSSTHETVPYLRISYADHILAWLEKCLRATYSIVPINQVLLQYRAVVHYLTGKSMDATLMKTVAEFILQNPEIIRFRKQIAEAANTAHGTFLDRLADGIINGLQPTYQVRLRANLFKGSFGFDTNGALVITPPPESPLHGAPFEIWVEHIFRWAALVVGIESKYGKPLLSEHDELVLSRMNLILNRDSAATGYHKADAQSSWSGTYWPTGWHDILQGIDDEQLATLMATPLPETVARVCDAIRNHIALLERAYVEAQTEVANIGRPDYPSLVQNSNEPA